MICCHSTPARRRYFRNRSESFSVAFRARDCEYNIRPASEMLRHLRQTLMTPSSWILANRSSESIFSRPSSNSSRSVSDLSPGSYQSSRSLPISSSTISVVMRPVLAKAAMRSIARRRSRKFLFQ